MLTDLGLALLALAAYGELRSLRAWRAHRQRVTWERGIWDGWRPVGYLTVDETADYLATLGEPGVITLFAPTEIFAAPLGTPPPWADPNHDISADLRTAAQAYYHEQ